jgi:hypothetical protein
MKRTSANFLTSVKSTTVPIGNVDFNAYSLRETSAVLRDLTPPSGDKGKTCIPSER